MTDIEVNAIEMYNRNLEFFEKEHNSLYQKIKLFEESIQEGYYAEQWNLEYKNNNYFDAVIDDFWLYGEDSNIYSKKQKDATRFNRSNSFNTLLKFAKTKKNFKPNPNIEDSGLEYFTPMFNYIHNNSGDIDVFNNLPKIEKFMFIGIGLGLHINKIVKKINSKAYLIIEPNIEIFRLSLFVTDYSLLISENNTEDNKKFLFFSIAEEKEEFVATFRKFYSVYDQLNHIIKFDLFFDNYSYYFDYISNEIHRQSPFSFPFSTRLVSFKRNLEYFKKEYKYFNFNNEILTNKNVCILAAGPSLHKNIEWISKNKNKMVIIALASTLKTLAKSDIVPDIITSVDPYELVKYQFDVDEKYYKNSIFLCSSNTHPEVIKKIDEDNLYLYPVLSSIGTKVPSLSGITVSEVTYAMTLFMKPEKVFLFGIDAALDKKGFSHIKEHAHHTKRELKKANLLEDKSISETDVLEVPGNFDDMVFTTREFSPIIHFMDSYTKSLKGDIKVYNFSRGAKFEDIIPFETKDVNIEEFELINKEELNKNLNSTFTKYSVNSLDDEALESLNEELKLIKLVLKEIRKYKKKKFKDYNKMQYDRIGLLININEIFKGLKTQAILNIFTSYVLAADKILFDYFELSNKIKENKNNVSRMSHLWLSPLEKIILKIIEILEGMQK